MNKEKLLISVNEEDVQNIINCYEKDLKELMKLQNNWNELKKGLQSLFEFDYGVISKDYLECAEDTLEKMQELEQGK